MALMEKVEIKAELEWFSTYVVNKSRERQTEIADVTLTLDVNSGTHGLLINGNIDPHGEWRHYFSEEGSFLSLKMNSISPPEHVRYYGFIEVPCNRRNETLYLCQHSTGVDPTELDHNIESYMLKLMNNEFKTTQRFHVTLAHRPRLYGGVEK